ncbi:hypothetical protein CD351_02455 [Erythrobacter sp. KY5]|uniref:hypothetical protein n=1 Tax=Erythrobacter sp. KY5 TaxID=2011159 RepID=UPI000DBF040F|nr:hypothetical protein [Erythrobacter sp. KY5]AWW73285.1 hypothetical protein CD351_02455 [Erythrobacter sp. KY5]
MLARLVPALALLAMPGTLGAKVDWKRIDLAAERAAIENYQSFDQRLQDVGWKLVRGNAEFCDRVIPSIGLQLQDLASYGGPEIARRALGMSGDFAVQTAARGSPSATSGAFDRNREIAALGSIDPNLWEAEDRLDWARLKRAHDHVDAVLSESGAIEIAFADGTRQHATPVPVCATRFELMGDGRKAVADGERVVIGIRFEAFSYEEEVFAGVVAHELAHNLLGHTAWLDRNGRTRRNVRRTEREADRLMPWLLANAGYDPVAAQTFMETWGKRHDGGLLRGRTHDGWDERAEFIAVEIPTIRAQMEHTGTADWRTLFRREIDPDAGL